MHTTIQMSHRLRRFRPLIGITIALTVLQCLLELYLPLLMAQIINQGVLAGSSAVITDTGKTMLAACIVMGTAGYAVNISCAYMSQRFALDLRQDLYRQIARFSLRQVEAFSPGSLITRMTSDVSSCAAFVNACIKLFVEPALLMVGGICLMWFLAPTLGAVFAAFSALQMTIMLLFIRKTAPLFMQVQRITDRINARLQTVFSNLRLIKSYTTEKSEVEHFRKENDSIFSASFQVQSLLAVFNPLVLLIMNLAVVLVLLYAGIRVADGRMPIGNVVAAITYSEQILLSIMVSGQLFRLAIEAAPSAHRILEVLQKPTDMPEIGDPVPAPFQSLRCDCISYAYPESDPVLKNCDFRIDRGEFVAVTGTIGGGKTTLVGLLSRLFDVTSGAVLLNETDIRQLLPSQVRRCIAVADRQAFLFDGTVEYNIRMGRAYVTPADIQKALETAQCGSFVHASGGLSAPLVSQGKNLSGGERQRLIIARALAGNPEVLIMDDCTGAIDYQTEKALLTAVRANYPEMTVLLVTHRLVSARMADKIAVLSDHRFAAEGTDAQLRSCCSVYQALCATQESREVSING